MPIPDSLLGATTPEFGRPHSNEPFYPVIPLSSNRLTKLASNTLAVTLGIAAVLVAVHLGIVAQDLELEESEQRAGLLS